MAGESLANAPVGRLAPSPTGLLHLGHARTFLLAWAHIRSRQGRVLLRIEDLDRERSKQSFTDALLLDLEWLGLSWDDVPVYQSARTDLYRSALNELSKKGLIYPCVCTRRDVRDAVTAPHLDSAEIPYPGTCRGRPREALMSTEKGLGAQNLRFEVPPEIVHFVDGIAGPQSYDVARESGDFIVARRDGVAAYQLAVVVDDAEQNVTEVMRGADLLSSTARQSLLQRALDLPHPEWFHVPLVVDDTGNRLAKRRDDLSLQSLRQAKVDPRAIIAWVARSTGFEATDTMTADDLVSVFALDRLRRSLPVCAFDPFTERSP